MANQPIGSGRSLKAAAWLILVLAGYSGSPGLLWAQAQEGSYATGGQPSIYVCIDPRGRRITADRPIPECIGTGQRELKASGRSQVRIIEGFLRGEAGALFEEWLKLPGHRNY